MKILLLKYTFKRVIFISGGRKHSEIQKGINEIFETDEKFGYCSYEYAFGCFGDYGAGTSLKRYT